MYRGFVLNLEPNLIPMRLIIAISACLISVSFLAQEETRLALVIGNANYNVGELKNPVNDALLVAATLHALDFDVILDTNITDKALFIKTIREFGDRRPDYDVAFIYYAGHGIQIGSENYLLPTAKTFESEFDVEDYGVSVKNIMRYLAGQSGKINVLILDACRNNPFEHKWNQTRSIGGGSGLAKIQPPSGSLIAFSTDPGATAADGIDENSIYCESLCKNMLRPETQIEQVFKYVRTDVEKATNNRQSPVEMQKLTGEEFYLVKSDFEEEYDRIVLLIEEEDYYEALSIVHVILTKSSTPRAYNSRANIYVDLEEYDKALEDYAKCIALDPEYVNAYFNRANMYLDLGEYDKALEDYAKCIALDPEDPDAYYNRALLYEDLEEYDKALEDYAKCIVLNPEYVNAYNNRAALYQNIGEYDKALEEYAKCIALNPEDPDTYYNRALLYGDLEEYDKALEEYAKCIALNPEYSDAYCGRAVCHVMMEQYDKANHDFNEAIKLDPENTTLYFDRAKMHALMGAHDQEKADYLKTIDLNEEDPEGYYYLALTYARQNESFHAISYISKAIARLSADLGYYISEGLDESRIELSDLYLIRAEVYKNVDAIDLMCEDYQRACELGDCELYEEYCE